MRQQTLTYLHDIPLHEARAVWHEALQEIGALRRLPSESIPVADANGRITAAPVWARISVPHYHSAAMDGYAVRAAATEGATLTRPLRLGLGTQAVFVDTGDPLPAEFDAVVPIEEAQRLDTDLGSQIEILAALTPWKHVRTMGEDIVATELVVSANHRLRPQDLGAIAGSGHTEVQVYRRPCIAILPTGSESVPPGVDLKPGDIIEFNSIILAAMATEWGAVAPHLSMLADDYETIKRTVVAALDDYDLVVVNAGSSAGSGSIHCSHHRRIGRGAGARHRHPPRSSRRFGARPRQTGGGHPRLSGQRHDHVRSTGQTVVTAMDGPGTGGPPTCAGDDHPQSPLGDGPG